MPETKTILLKKAIEFATLKHSGQKRKSGEDYIVHPLAVIEKVRNLGLAEEYQAAAILHDVIEDCGVTKEDLKPLFGEEILYMVFFLSKPSRKEGLSSIERIKLYIELMEVGTGIHPEIMIIKMCDQLDNLETLGVFKLEKQAEKLKELSELYFPFYIKYIEKLPEDSKKIYLEAYKQLVTKVEEEIKRVKDEFSGNL